MRCVQWLALESGVEQGKGRMGRRRRCFAGLDFLPPVIQTEDEGMARTVWLLEEWNDNFERRGAMLPCSVL